MSHLHIDSRQIDAHQKVVANTIRRACLPNEHALIPTRRSHRSETAVGTKNSGRYLFHRHALHHDNLSVLCCYQLPRAPPHAPLEIVVTRSLVAGPFSTCCRLSPLPNQDCAECPIAYATLVVPGQIQAEDFDLGGEVGEGSPYFVLVFSLSLAVPPQTKYPSIMFVARKACRH